MKFLPVLAAVILASGCLDGFDGPLVYVFVGSILGPHEDRPEGFKAEAVVEMRDGARRIGRSHDGDFPLYQAMYENGLPSFDPLRIPNGTSADELRLTLRVRAPGSPWDGPHEWSWPIQYKADKDRPLPLGVVQGGRDYHLYFHIVPSPERLTAQFYNDWHDEGGASAGSFDDGVYNRTLWLQEQRRNSPSTTAT